MPELGSLAQQHQPRGPGTPELPSKEVRQPDPGPSDANGVSLLGFSLHLSHRRGETAINHWLQSPPRKMQKMLWVGVTLASKGRGGQQPAGMCAGLWHGIHGFPATPPSINHSNQCFPLQVTRGGGGCHWRGMQPDVVSSGLRVTWPEPCGAHTPRVHSPRGHRITQPQSDVSREHHVRAEPSAQPTEDKWPPAGRGLGTPVPAPSGVSVLPWLSRQHPCPAAAGWMGTGAPQAEALDFRWGTWWQAVLKSWPLASEQAPRRNRVRK